ncbi:MAG: SDR family oxidoreductase [Pseudomonadota bacterium]
MPHLLAIGLGYTAQYVVNALQAGDGAWSFTGTARTAEKCAAREAEGINMLRFDPAEGIIPESLPADITHLLISAAPSPSTDTDPHGGDPVIAHLDEHLVPLLDLEWVGYLSTIGVYGNADGAWIDETTPPNPKSERGVRRLRAEAAWQDFGKRTGVATQIFRLPGIYGPGRSPLKKVAEGTARRIVKPGQVFNRAHVEDIAQVIAASIHRPNAGAIYNISDDEPAPPQDVITYAAELLGMEPPPSQDFATADMTEMARSFYSDNKRVGNARIKEELGVALRYPTYREGLRAVAAMSGLGVEADR